MREPGEHRIDEERDIAERKAIDALGRYKFQMFGYWAAIWVHLNRLSVSQKPNPFRALVHAARETQRSALGAAALRDPGAP